MKNINPKMQPKFKPALRKWQVADDPTRDYGLGECPLCGGMGDFALDSNQWEIWTCTECGAEYEYERSFVFRFVRMIESE